MVRVFFVHVGLFGCAERSSPTQPPDTGGKFPATERHFTSKRDLDEMCIAIQVLAKEFHAVHGKRGVVCSTLVL